MNELEWLAERRPELPAADEETTAYARTALLAYTAGTEGVPAGARRPGRATSDPSGEASSHGSVVAPPHTSARNGRRRPVGLFAIAAVVFAAAIVVVAGALPSGDGPAKRIGAPVSAEAAPLVKLVKSIQQQPPPAGDATLVLRSHDFPTAKDFKGADLYLDDGRYFYGSTLDELRSSADLGEGVPKQEREAAVAANDLEPAAARKAMIDATWPGGHPPTAEAAAAQAVAAKETLRKKLNGEKLPPPASRLSIDNNRIWIGSMDTLISGAGDAQVRAGVMKLLGTVDAVKVTDRGATLELTNTDFGDGYQETLVVDARTGVIQKMIGGYPGKTPSVTVTYDVERVDAKDYVTG